MPGKHAPLAERFHRHWTGEPNSGCWLWIGSIDGNGYGQITHERKRLKASRVSWEIHYGKIPADLHVLHKCDVPCCVCPTHLWLGTRSDNIRDAVTKGRLHNQMMKRTHCPQGHAYSGLDCYGYRVCILCRRAFGRIYDAKRRAKKRNERTRHV